MSGTSKFYKQKRQVSYDSGTTWQDVVPAQYQKGDLYELNSPDCGYEQLERWVNSGTTCSGASGYDKYYLQVKQTSTDGGTTWTTTSDRRLGTLIEANSTDCGYVSTTKFKATYNGGRTYSEECDGNITLTQTETRPNGYAYSSMTNAEIGNCITKINNYAFEDCSSLTSVTIPNSVTTIGIGAFEDCSSLTSIGSVGSGASIEIPSGVTIIDSYTFIRCSGLTSIDIPNNVTNIGNWAFADCSSISSCTIPNSATVIGNYAFRGCSGLTSITIPDSVTTIGNAAFSGCTSLTSINIPSGVTSIGDWVFDRCSGLTSIDIPSGVTSIGISAFAFCNGLTSINIPSGVTSIGAQAFLKCSGLTSLTVNATTPPTLENRNAIDITANYPIYVPANSVNTYKTADIWSNYASRIQAIP